MSFSGTVRVGDLRATVTASVDSGAAVEKLVEQVGPAFKAYETKERAAVESWKATLWFLVGFAVVGFLFVAWSARKPMATQPAPALDSSAVYSAPYYQSGS